MALSLNFRIEDRSGVMVVITQFGPNEQEQMRPATHAEVELWNALTRRLAMPTRESYIRVNEQDLAGIVIERDSLRRIREDLEKRNTDNAHQIEELKQTVEDLRHKLLALDQLEPGIHEHKS